MVYTKATKDGNVPVVVRPNKEIMELEKKSKEMERVNLDDADVRNWVNRLINECNKAQDIGMIRSWWRGSRIESQTNYQKKVWENIDQIIKNANDIIELKTTLISQQAVIESRTVQRMKEAGFEVERQQETQNTFILEEKTKRAKMDLEVKKLEEEIRQESARANFLELRTEIANNIKKEMKFNQLDMKQVLVIIEMLKEATSERDLFAAEARWKQAMAEADKTKAETSKIKQEVRFKKAAADDRVIDLKKIHEEMD